MHRLSIAAVLGCLVLLPLTSRARGDDPLTLNVETRKPAVAISPEMVGLSYETALLLPNTKGERYFRPDNRPLIALFRTLGVKSLRIGGNSVDTSTFAVPSDDDMKAFFEFARAAHVKVIYSVRLKDAPNDTRPAGTLGNVESAANIARFIHERYSDVLECFAIGNEPSYLKDYTLYTAHWKAIRDAIVTVYPEATFCGPDEDPKPELDKKMVTDFGNAEGRLVKVSQHTYPFGCSFKNPKMKDDVSKLIPVDAAAGREKMLSPNAYAIYEKIYDGIAKSIADTPLTYCLSETNSFWFSGLKGASDSHASALWAVDYLYWWAAHGANNINFHTGDRTGGEVTLPCQYSAFVTKGNGYEVRPLAYGMKVFDLGGRGSEVPVHADSTAKQNLVEYATLSEGKVVCVTLINKSHGASAETMDVRIQADVPLATSGAEVIYLRSKDDDVAAGWDAEVLGGAPIKADGSWEGHWDAMPASAYSGDGVRVKIPPASAVVVRTHIR